MARRKWDLDVVKPRNARMGRRRFAMHHEGHPSEVIRLTPSDPNYPEWAKAAMEAKRAKR